jgi:toxin ParE1/3/4
LKRFALAKAAKGDIAEIWDYVADKSPDFADELLESFFRCFQRIGMTPYLGRAREAFGPGIRTVAEGDYIVLYRIARPGVRIVRVIHGKRNIPAVLKKQ